LNYLEGLGIKEHVVTWKQWHDQILEKLERKNEDDQSIKNLEEMLHIFQFLENKGAFISLLYVLRSSIYFIINNNTRSKLLIYNKLVDVKNKL
jgi:hypothetical protein